MSINGNYNVLLGAGAQLPSAAASHQIVLGSSADTVYLGGAGTSSAGGVIINSAGVTLSGVATFTVSGKTGALGQALTSAGAGRRPTGGRRCHGRSRLMARRSPSRPRWRAFTR
jgi:hypothetical protein